MGHLTKEEEDQVIDSIIEEPYEIHGINPPLWLDILGGISLLVIIFFVVLMMMFC